MNLDMIAQFEKKYVSLSGHSHVAENIEGVITTVMAILHEAQATRVVFGEMPDLVVTALEKACTEAGIEVLKPPYDNTQLPKSIDEAQVGISWAAFAVAESGSLIEFTTNDATRLVSTLPRIHIGIFNAQNLLPTLKSAAAPLREFYQTHLHHATATFISGPSRTADIEMRLTLGVHGPEVAHAVVLKH